MSAPTTTDRGRTRRRATRTTVTREDVGERGPRWVVRHRGAFVSHHATRTAGTTAARELRAELAGMHPAIAAHLPLP